MINENLIYYKQIIKKKQQHWMKFNGNLANDFYETQMYLHFLLILKILYFFFYL